MSNKNKKRTRKNKQKDNIESLLKIVVVCPDYDYVSGNWTVNTPYYKLAQQFGTVKLVRPNSPYIPCDLLILPGGADVNPVRYGKYPTLSGFPNLEYEYFETQVQPLYESAGVPILGVCRGMQSTCVNYGATLIQDVPGLPRSVGGKADTKKQHKIKGERHKIVENLRLAPDYEWISAIPSGVHLGINSLHHQVVDLATLPDEVVPIGYSSVSGNLEMCSIKDKNILLVQYHPEELLDKRLIKFIIKNLINGKITNWN